MKIRRNSPPVKAGMNGQLYINLGKSLDSELKDGDEITLCPVLSGG